MDIFAQTKFVPASPEFMQESASLRKLVRAHWNSDSKTSQVPKPPLICYNFDSVSEAWSKFLGQTLVETNNIEKILSRSRKRMAKRAKTPRPVVAPIVVPPSFERDISDGKRRVNYMMMIRLELGVGAFYDTYHHAPRYPDIDMIMALQRLRKKFPDLVLGQDEKKLWKRMTGSEPK
jgi:hypothetical protein